jgi:hypothetical protein
VATYVEQVIAPYLGLHVVEKLQLGIMNADSMEELWNSTESDRVYGDQRIILVEHHLFEHWF